MHSLVFLAKAEDTVDQLCNNGGPGENDSEEDDSEGPGEPQEVVGTSTWHTWQGTAVVTRQYPY